MDNSLTFLNACRNGQKSIVHIFLDKGTVDIDKRDAEGNTPLYYACRQGHRDVVSLLLDRGADATLANNRGETPLHAAAQSGNKEIVALLARAGADLNATDCEGRTPLMALLDCKRTDAALCLMGLGADTGLTDRSGHTALDYATAHGLREVVDLLAHEATCDARGNTALHQAVYNEQSEVLRTLLADSKAQLNAVNDEGETPLLLACGRSNLLVAELLIAAGADVNRASLAGVAPLHAAATSGNRFIGQALLAAGVSLLIAARAAVNVADNLQHTALYYASERGFGEIVEMLLLAGAEG